MHLRLRFLALRCRTGYAPSMKRITYSAVSMLVGDDVAGVLLDYAALLASTKDADTVTITGYDAHGEEMTVRFVISTGVSLASSAAVTDLPDPDNANILMYIREQMMRRSSPPGREPTDQTMPDNYEDLNL